jgi:Zn-dependent protease
MNRSLTLFHFGRVPVRAHWSILLGILVFSGFRIDPVGWFGVLGIIFVHEAGHALVVKWVGGRATAIEFTGFGGLCWWEGEVSAAGRAAIAWGGVWAQLVLLGAALVADAWAGPFTSPAGWRLLEIATASNVWMALFNLIPLKPLDGAEAWTLPYLLGRWTRQRLAHHLAGRQSAPLAREDEAAPEQLDPAHEASARALASQLLEAARRPESQP